MTSLITLFKYFIGFDILLFLHSSHPLGYTLLSDIWTTRSEHMFSLKLLKLLKFSFCF